MENNTQFAKRMTLKEIRMNTGLTQEQFSKFVEIPYNTYKMYENDISKIEIGRLFKICNRVGIPVEEVQI
ncbi:DNA-binding XRE family transcriptional regulator [Lachnotalea glycerini]|nr:helix-turn-helix transcriptional regulator [Lachnotalea glycerini]PXV85941.1 DNA-binding XRE family transcriptional regulator [Lachnotalea glycerini]